MEHVDFKGQGKELVFNGHRGSGWEDGNILDGADGGKT